MQKSNKTFLIRFNAGSEYGIGHAKRCLALAEWLYNNYNLKIVLCCNQSKFIRSLISPHSYFDVEWKEKSESEESFLYRSVELYEPSLLFIDSLYSYSKEAVIDMKKITKIVFFHNLSAGSEVADITIIPTAHIDLEDIDRLTNASTDFYYGFKYVLINPEILSYGKQSNELLEKEDYLVITAGGSDPHGVQIKIMELLKKKNLELPTIFLLGLGQKDRESIISMSLSREFIKTIDFDLNILSNARLAVCAFGVTAYELIYLNIPLIGVGINSENGMGCKRLDETHQVIRYAGEINDLDEEFLFKSLHDLWDGPNRKKMKYQQSEAIDGKGMERIGSLVMNGINGG